MTYTEACKIVDDVQFPGYTFVTSLDFKSDALCVYAVYMERDTITNKREEQKTREWLLHPGITRSEVVATCFKCIIASMEHKTREWFTYRNKAIFQPHHDVDKLLAICEERP